MKFSISKSYPHPVLRVRSSDYIDAEFRMDFSIERLKTTTAIKVNVQFILTDPYLLQLVSSGSAKYLLLIRCVDTFFREAICERVPKIQKLFSNGQLAGRTEFSPFLVTKEKITEFRSPKWNSDYDGLSFDPEPGVVLAVAPPETYWIDTADEAHVGSIFKLLPSNEIDNGYWECLLESDQIMLKISKGNFNQFLQVRDHLLSKNELEFIMNGVYLPALIWVLTEADNNFKENDYERWRWFSSLNHKLEELKLPQFGKSSDRIVDAQKLLNAPFESLISLLEAV